MAEFNWKWKLTDLNIDKPVKVFSTFSCGGGSSMGYKRAGFEVLGNVEIDPKMNAIYKANNHPKYNYNMDLRQFNQIPNDKLPQELFNLDILDGSPPCSTFSMAGKREKGWGVEKQFREGQKKQTLDDLFFVFLETVKKLQPKIFVAENVSGIIRGNAKVYCKRIIEQAKEMGYDVQVFSLNSANMDCPQARERVFFIGNRCGLPKLKMKFNRPLITFGEVRSKNGIELKDGVCKTCLSKMKKSDRSIADINKRDGKNSGYTIAIVHDYLVCNTIKSTSIIIRGADKKKFSNSDFINVQTFPQDYNFSGQSVQYVCGMSVPPNMMAHIATEIWNQWLKK